MKNIGIIVTDHNDPTAQLFQTACRSNGVNPHMIDLRRTSVTIGKSIRSQIIESVQELDAMIVRDVGSGAFEGISYRFDVLRQLEQEGVMIVNSPASIQNAANKYYASGLMKKAGISIPKTLVVQNTEDAMKIFDKIDDSVIKPIFGYKGIGIVRIKDKTVIDPDGTSEELDLENIIDIILKERGMLHIQEFIENPGRDIRAFVVNEKVVAAIYRTAPKGAWINNLSQGGKESRCELTEFQKEMCVKASKAIGTSFAGVDLIENYNGMVETDKTMVLEVNATPSVAGIYKAWGINAAEDIIKGIISKI